MTMYLSPLVDVNEIDLTTTIPAVATSIGVIILRDTWKGPEAKVQLVNNINELIQIFGRPEEAVPSGHGQSYEDLLGAAGFLQFGSNLYCTRVLAPSATFAGLYGTVDELGVSLSSSSSSSSTNCVEGYEDFTGPLYFNPATWGSWNPVESRYESVGGDPNHIVDLTRVDTLSISQPTSIRLNVEIRSGFAPGDLVIDNILIEDTFGNTIYSNTTQFVDALDTPKDIILTGISYIGSLDIDLIIVEYQHGGFYIHSIELYNDCPSSSSSSTSSCTEGWVEEAISGIPSSLLFDTVELGTFNSEEDRIESENPSGDLQYIILNNYTGSCAFRPKVKIVCGLISNPAGNIIDEIILYDELQLESWSLTNVAISGGIETDNTFIFDLVYQEFGGTLMGFNEIRLRSSNNNEIYLKSLEVWDDCEECPEGGEGGEGGEGD